MEFSAFDTYSLKARYTPAAIVVAPICLLVLAFSIGQLEILKTVGVTVVSTLGMALLLDQIGRDPGRQKQKELFKLWSGAPTTRILRHRDSWLDRHTLQRYHRTLATLLPDLQLPTPEQETADSEAADSVYESCAAHLREKTRNKDEYALVFQENTNYGFRRNLFGMKSAGMAIAIAGTLACGVLAAYRSVYGNGEWLVPSIATFVNACLLALWAVRVVPDWVRTAADAYAGALVASLEKLTTKE